ncbi:peptidoglycan D,D-transpeptidase FtsI family protein [Frondihabitans australicus]|nr:penicillin-binding protein 2 [Frondihabitans australicus]
MRPLNRRTGLVAGIMLALILALAVRLVDLQVVDARTLDAESNSQISVTQPIYADRGDIDSADGTVLASTVLRYDVTAAPAEASTFSRADGKKSEKVTVEQAMISLAKITGTPAKTLLSRITANPKSQYALLASSVDVSAYDSITALKIPYVYLERHTARTYPDGAVAGNLVGFTGDSGAQAGLELKENSCLAGTDGSETYERSADGTALPGTTTVTKKAVSGGTVETTIDADLQYQVQQVLDEQVKALGAQSGTAIVERVSDGHLLAVADSPSVDPNNVNGTASGNLYSKAFTDLYEPGSTMKVLSAASLIDQGKASPSTEVTVPDERTFPWGGRIGDAETHPVEKLTLTGILANSSNVGISLIGTRLSKQERYDYLEKFGLGQVSGVDFPGEPTAPLKPVSQWDEQTNYNELFGQGISATAIQMADAYQAIANGGVRIPATLVTGCRSADGTVTKTAAQTPVRVVSSSTSKQMLEMMETTMQSGTLSGTAPISGYSIATKTGTAQIADAPNGGYGQDYVTSVAAIAPAADPQYVVFITFTKPTVNKTSAGVGPAFREITSDVLQDYRVTPNDQESNLPTIW